VYKTVKDPNSERKPSHENSRKRLGKKEKVGNENMQVFKCIVTVYSGDYEFFKRWS